MKDNMKVCQHALADDMEFKEVVVIGNGPSGMVTSFMLAGNVPYLKEIPKDLPIDEMLRARLSRIPPGQSLYDVDLSELADGMEGRSLNPISLLIDVLMRPCADLGIQAESLVHWQYENDKQIDHVVLGRGPPGGAWHGFPGSVRTLSPAAWLTLPPHTAPAPANTRTTARAVTKYCRRYVQACNLQRYFRSDVIVTSVTRATSVHEPCAHPSCPLTARFIVSGYDRSRGCAFRYACTRVVVASGGNDRANTLPPHIQRHATDMNTLGAVAASGGVVLVVGSGVSAADAVLAALGGGGGVTVAHVHRTAAPALAALSPRTYPDYYQVYKMMSDPTGNYENYKSYPNHVIIEVIPENQPTSHKLKDIDDEAITPKRVKLLNLVTNEIFELKVSLISVLIGSKPDLYFLRTNFNLSYIDMKRNCNCLNNKKPSKIRIEEENQRQCFLRNHWLYLKSILEQSIQNCKSRYLSTTEINGNDDTKCILPNCNNNRDTKKCMCNILVSKLENGTITTSVQKEDCKCETIPYSQIENKICHCEETNPYSNGIGFGVDPKKPVDCRSNPVAVDKGTHEMLNAPKGMYALGPLTTDNFIRFIPGGAIAIVTHIHKQRNSQ